MENFLTQVMTSHGYLALIIFAFIEACCIPISSEITFAFAGVIAVDAPGQVHDRRGDHHRHASPRWAAR